jgi:hypothetical protein
LFLLAAWQSASSLRRSIKIGRFWDPFFKHHYSRERHPSYFWLNMVLKSLSVFLWALMSLILFLNRNPFSGRPIFSASTTPKRAEYLSSPRLGFGLTLSSTRTPPALPSALCHLLASSAPLSASVQAGPVSFIR